MQQAKLPIFRSTVASPKMAQVKTLIFTLPAQLGHAASRTSEPRCRQEWLKKG
ncbi:MAG TPA: hypothetical protein VHC22_32430 [Pirellulales bacterium]|nr:hypothetical protein [Pirellulales bacterium]